jgi:ribokinase
MGALDVVVVGSVNMDLVARTPRMPAPGETIAGSRFATVSGGKGANQAVAAARLGARTAMVGCVGDDVFGEQLRGVLRADGVDCGLLRVCKGSSSGVAVIVVDEAGRNGIVIVAGANGELSRDDVDRGEALVAEAKIVALQLEVPLDTVQYAAARARALGKLVVLTPAPAQPLPSSLLRDVDYLVPNEIEAQALSGVEVASPAGAIEAGRRLLSGGARNVLVTLGASGVVVVTSEGAEHHPAPEVKAVDTTAAGDTFIGGLCAVLVEGRPLRAAIAFAQAAAAISVTRFGAQSSIPRRGEVRP